MIANIKPMRALEIFEVFTTGDEKLRFEERRQLAVYLAECMRAKDDADKRKKNVKDRFEHALNEEAK